ncbi:hypothetical protein SEPMUDRAFT_162610 [Lecanosticta acicola]|uniref:Phosphatidylinositol N-acetylglucosaminyltransferase subunit H conserved domain-containing protein n=1 Tax=Lecanosticta acicola TaxID=111012 RepID=A0AAI8YR75_9PEZI|nr:hypothetical protein SEPMUDRAFT_162610 [Lecanosticta acicola]
MLTTKRPTPTTVLYTVSTRGQSKSLPARLSTYASVLLRLVAGILVLAVLLHEFASHYHHHHQDQAHDLPTWLLGFRNFLLWFYETTNLTLRRRILLCVVTTWLIFRKGYTEESLFVIRGLGVQTSTSSSSWLLGTGKTRFIPTRAIQDVFLYEAFKGFEVRFYLGIVVEGEEDVVVVFPSILPRREILEKVWRGAR